MPSQITDRLVLALAQLNPTLGAVQRNLDAARTARAEAAQMGADIIAFPELFLSGYPPEDLVLKPAFLGACKHAIETFALETDDGGPAVIMGLPWREGEQVFNSIAVLDGGKLTAIRHKVELPNYGPFDEKRVFAMGPMPGPVNIRGVRVGIPICEDIWIEDVAETLAETGAELLISPNGSPWWRNKHEERLNVVVARVTESDLPIAYLNQVGGQDELIFDGGSFGLNSDHSVGYQLPAFEEAVACVRWQREAGRWRMIDGPVATLQDDLELTWMACVLGLRDYVGKNGFPAVVLGLSGGIDSAMCAAMAVDALGADKVRCVMMPYHYTASDSLEDAKACAVALGASYESLAIEEAVAGLEAALAPAFAGTKPDVTEENLQSRVRGTMLMAISNKFGPMVVTTGNKSEVSVGYATLYGDMNGGFNPIKDLYKTEVFQLASFRNTAVPRGCLGPDGEVIPQRIITKPPSAELRPDQTDQDSLPPYDVLDAILTGLVEDERSLHELVQAGFDEQTVRKIEQLLYIAEYKRRQAAPGVKITRRNFGRDRRYPITNRYRDNGQPVPEFPAETERLYRFEGD